MKGFILYYQQDYESLELQMLRCVTDKWVVVLWAIQSVTGPLLNSKIMKK